MRCQPLNTVRMSSLWGKIKVHVDSASSGLQNLSLNRNAKDRNEDDTIITRALLRYYGPSAPDWLPRDAVKIEPARLALDAMPGISRTSSQSTSNLRSHTYDGALHARGSLNDMLAKRLADRRATEQPGAIKTDNTMAQGLPSPTSPVTPTSPVDKRMSGERGRSALGQRLKKAAWT